VDATDRAPIGTDSHELASLQTENAETGSSADSPKPVQTASAQAETLPGDLDTARAGDGSGKPDSLTMVSLADTPSAGSQGAVPAARSLEESVAAVLDRLSCAAVNASVQGGRVNLRGYVSEKLDMAGLEKNLLALPGARQVSSSLKTVDSGKCAVIDLFAPYWAIHQTAGSGASIQVRGDNNELTEGDALIVDITTPPRESYVNVDYFSLDGGVVHMLPGPRASNNQAPANYKATIGDLGEWTIAKPFGNELVTLITTPRPLFDKARDEYEQNTDYLAAVRKRLDRISKESGKQSVSVDFVMINTKPKSLLQQLREAVPLQNGS
jgi:hypothetical protein